MGLSHSEEVVEDGISDHAFVSPVGRFLSSLSFLVMVCVLWWYTGVSVCRNQSTDVCTQYVACV